VRIFEGCVRLGPDGRVAEAGTGTGIRTPSKTNGSIIAKRDNVASTWSAKRTKNGRECAAVKNVSGNLQSWAWLVSSLFEIATVASD